MRLNPRSAQNLIWHNLGRISQYPIVWTSSKDLKFFITDEQQLLTLRCSSQAVSRQLAIPATCQLSTPLFGVPFFGLTPLSRPTNHPGHLPSSRCQHVPGGSHAFPKNISSHGKCQDPHEQLRRRSWKDQSLVTSIFVHRREKRERF